MQHAEKQAFIDEMRDSVASVSGMFFVDYTGLTVAEANDFRRILRAASIRYRVVKNTLLTLALKDTPCAPASRCLQGTPTGVIIAEHDAGSAAKITLEFMEDCEHLKIKGGIVEQRALSVAEVEAIAKLPSKEVLLGQVLGLAMSPGRQLLSLIKGPAGRIVGAIDAKADAGATDSAAEPQP